MRSHRLWRRGNIWWCSYYVGKQRVRESTRCTSKRAAEAYLLAAEGRPYNEAGPTAPQTVHDAIDWLIDHAMPDRSPATHGAYRHHGGHVARLLGETQVAELRRDDVLKYISARLKEEAHRHTVGKELTVLRCALREAGKRGFTRQAPEQIVPEWKSGYTPRKRVLEQAEIDKLLKVLLPHRVWWIQVALNTGGRRSEVEGLLWEEHVDWTLQRVLLPGTKTQKSRRWIPMTAQFAKLLGEHKQEKGPVVRPWVSADKDLKRACARAGISKFSFNDLRRSFASHLVRAGVSLKVVATLLGHSTTAMVDRVYGHLAEEQLGAAMKRLDAAVQTTGTPASQSVVKKGRKGRKTDADPT